MEEGTKVSGYVNTARLNRRSSPGGAIILTSLTQGTSIQGEIEKDDAGGDWVRLETINGESVVIVQYVAAWYCHLDAVNTPPVPPTPPATPKEISCLATITPDGKLLVEVTEPNGYPYAIIVNGKTLIDSVMIQP